MATIIADIPNHDFGNGPTALRESSVNALKSLLSLPTANLKSTPQPKAVPSPQCTTPPERVTNKTSRVVSPPNVSPDSKPLSRSTKKSKKKIETPVTPSFFAGSAFQNSPDPISIPMPSFDDDPPETVDEESMDNVVNSPQSDAKTVLLRRLLKVEK